ncbi:hypothetical protein [Pseudomonas syringae]|uniref:hypothetical protein n=1 Tax=Pseudomonas syringae TaxID=317 RepID=UPI0012AEC150|nr:hypothetical protein [Pseudomonas syringae]
MSNLLMENNTEHASIIPTLQALLGARGIMTPKGAFLYKNLNDPMTDQFGIELMNFLGINLPSHNQKQRRTNFANLFSMRTKLPNILHTLLLSKLVTDDARDLKRPVAATSLNTFPCETRKHLLRGDLIPRDQLVSALKDANGILDRARKILAVSFEGLLSSARYHRIPIPLTERQCERIGWDTLKEIRRCCIEGLPMHQIRAMVGLGQFMMVRVLASDPALDELHEKGTHVLRLQTSKEKLLSVTNLDSKASRTTMRKTHGRLVDFVLKYDPEWAAENLPPPATIIRHGSGPRSNWHKREKIISSEIADTIQKEHTKHDRPLKLTISRLKKSAFLANINQFPSPYRKRIQALLDASAEPHSAFLERLIKWAINEYSKLSIPISSNRLRRVARLSIKQLHECRPLVIAYAQELKLGFHSKCSLSPLSPPPS